MKTKSGSQACLTIRSRGRQSTLISWRLLKNVCRRLLAATSGRSFGRTLACMIVAMLAAFTAHAQPVRFQVTAYTDRGGGSSSGGTFAVTGTSGQIDAGITSGGGRFGVSGGFWSTVEEVLPRLVIRRQGNQVILSWPNPSTGFQLQETSVLGPSEWANVGTAPSVVASNKQVSLTIGPGSRGFRLCRP
jgi:hypothetical protein